MSGNSKEVQPDRKGSFGIGRIGALKIWELAQFPGLLPLQVKTPTAILHPINDEPTVVGTDGLGKQVMILIGVQNPPANRAASSNQNART